MINFFKPLLETNFFISICSSFLYLFYAYQSDSNFPLTNIIFIFNAVTLGYYFLQNIEKVRNKSFSFKNQKYKLLYLCFHIFSFFYFHPPFESLNLILLAISFFIFFIYETFFFKYFSLRRFALLKPLSIGLVWATLITGLQKIFHLNMFLDCLTFVALLSLPFDLKDLHYDQSHNTKTLAYIFPRLPIGIAILTAIFTALFYKQEEVIFFLLFFPIMALSTLNHSRLSPWAFYLIFDGLILLRSLLYFF